MCWGPGLEGCRGEGSRWRDDGLGVGSMPGHLGRERGEGGRGVGRPALVLIGTSSRAVGWLGGLLMCLEETIIASFGSSSLNDPTNWTV